MYTQVFFGNSFFTIMFNLIVDDFGIKYSGDQNAKLLIDALQQNYTIDID